MHKTLILTMFLVLPFLTACQGFMQPTPAPTLTVVSLASGVKVEPTGTPLAARVTVQPRSARPRRRLPQQTVQPTATTVGQRIMALGVRPRWCYADRRRPARRWSATLPGSQVTWAEGRSPDGRWLRVAYGDVGVRAWLALGDVNLLGEVADLPQIGPEAAHRARPQRLHRQPRFRSRALRVAPPDAVLADQVNVRRGPGPDQAVIGQTGAGQPISVIGRSREGIGWRSHGRAARDGCPRSLIELSGSAADLPALAAADQRRQRCRRRSVGFQRQNRPPDRYRRRYLHRECRWRRPAAFDRRHRSGALTRWDTCRLCALGSPHGIFVLDLRTGQEQRIASVNRPRGPTWGSRWLAARLHARHTHAHLCRDWASVASIRRGTPHVRRPRSASRRRKAVAASPIFRS